MPKQIIISNIGDEIFAHFVNGCAQSPTAFQDLSIEEQQELVKQEILDFCHEKAKAYAVVSAQQQAAVATIQLANALIEQSNSTIGLVIEEVPV